jgi:hypothetical protein
LLILFLLTFQFRATSIWYYSIKTDSVKSVFHVDSPLSLSLFLTFTFSSLFLIIILEFSYEPWWAHISCLDSHAKDARLGKVKSKSQRKPRKCWLYVVYPIILSWSLKGRVSCFTHFSIQHA